VDCNLGSKSLSFSFVRFDAAPDAQTNPLYSVSLLGNSVSKAFIIYLDQDQKFLQTTLTMNEPIPGLDDTDLAGSNSCRIVFKNKNKDISKHMCIIFGNTLEVCNWCTLCSVPISNIMNISV
jgi:hypothetical protein